MSSKSVWAIVALDLFSQGLLRLDVGHEVVLLEGAGSPRQPDVADVAEK